MICVNVVYDVITFNYMFSNKMLSNFYVFGLIVLDRNSGEIFSTCNVTFQKNVIKEDIKIF